jgi:hypothetical protein
MEEKIQLKHPAGKKAVSMDSIKYDILKNALINHLKKNGESTHAEIRQAVIRDLKTNKINFNGSVEWHTEWVKLDLEANKIIERVPGTSSVKYSLAK